MSVDNASTIFFYRDFQGFSGGHMKVWHYFCHAQQSRRFIPRIFLTDSSVCDDSNPWSGITPSPLPAWNPIAADALFLAGLDWLAVPETPPCPVVNLVQHIRHGTPDDPRYAFLSRRAIRICVSEEVTSSILASGRVNGPVVTIPNAIDVQHFPAPAQVRDIALLIVGLKNPALAAGLASRLRHAGVHVTCQTQALPQREFLELIGRAETVVFLPTPQEGFYLPALEGMAMGALVICPDCVGNRSFCHDQVNCYRPTYTVDAIEQAVLLSIAMSLVDRAVMTNEGRQEALQHAFGKERRAFLDILDDLSSLW